MFCGIGSPIPSPEKPSPNKSPPNVMIKGSGFNPNAPTFVPMALQRNTSVSLLYFDSLCGFMQVLSAFLSNLPPVLFLDPLHRNFPCLAPHHRVLVVLYLVMLPHFLGDQEMSTTVQTNLEWYLLQFSQHNNNNSNNNNHNNNNNFHHLYLHHSSSSPHKINQISRVLLLLPSPLFSASHLPRHL